MAKDSIFVSKKVRGQSVASDVSSVEGALAHVGQVSPPTPSKSLILAKNDPKTEKGYENLGAGGPPHTGKPYPPKVNENRGAGSA
jgi:hypothetical protein